jgi:hypothetical protein
LVVPGAVRERGVDVAIVILLALLVFLVHPLGAMFRRPYWLDEAWVADLAKAPLSRQAELSSSTPIGWALLLRLVPSHAAQRFRVIPLTFSVAGAIVAYLLVRGLNWRDTIEARGAGVVAVAAVVLAPISLARNDLKQYTADATLALLVLLLGRNAEQDGRRRSLVMLAIVSFAVTPFSTVAALVTIAVFVGLLGAAALEKQWHRVREVLVCGVGSGVAIGAYVAAFVLPHDNKRLRDYWRPFYLTGTPIDVVSKAWHRFAELRTSLGVPAVVAFALFGLGVAALVARRHVALAIAVAVLWLEMFVLGTASIYPFLDARTSHFVLVVSLVTAAIGFVGLVLATVQHRRGLALGVALAAVALLAFGARHDIRHFADHREDSRAQARYVAAHRNARDVVVISVSGNYGFTYYWPGREHKEYRHSSRAGAGFFARVDGINAVFATDRTPAAVFETMRVAIAHWQTLGGTGRIWIVRSHVGREELEAWSEALRVLQLRPVAATQGHEPLLVADP